MTPDAPLEEGARVRPAPLQATSEHLANRLGASAPDALYGCGRARIVNEVLQGLAVVGPRDASPDVLDCARRAGVAAAEAGRVLVSGLARGVDRAAMYAAMDAGGMALGVLPRGFYWQEGNVIRTEKSGFTRADRDWIRRGRLALVSPYEPEAGFTAWRALGRNKIIYALAAATLVVDALPNRGGSWAGAREALTRFGLPVFVRDTAEAQKPSPGLEALKSLGARPWENPQGAALQALLDECRELPGQPAGQAGLQVPLELDP